MPFVPSDLNSWDQDTQSLMCQWPGKMSGTQVCYIQEPLSHHFQPVAAP